MASPHVVTKVPVGQVNGDYEHCDTSSSRPIQHCSILTKTLNPTSCRLSCAQWCPVCQNRIQSEYSVTGLINPDFYPQDHQPSNSNSLKKSPHLDFGQYDFKSTSHTSPRKGSRESYSPSNLNSRTTTQYHVNDTLRFQNKPQSAKHLGSSFDELHDNYMKEVEALRGKLKELQGSINRSLCGDIQEAGKDCGDNKAWCKATNISSPLKSKVVSFLHQTEVPKSIGTFDGKRARQFSDSESNVLPLLENISKKARDVSPVSKKMDILLPQTPISAEGASTGDHSRNNDSRSSNMRPVNTSPKPVSSKKVSRALSPLNSSKLKQMMHSSPPNGVPRTCPSPNEILRTNSPSKEVQTGPPLRELFRASTPTREFLRPSPPREVFKTSPPQREAFKPCTPTREVCRTSPPPREVRKTSPPPREVRRISPPPREVRRISPPPREVHRTSPPPREVRRTSPHTREVLKTSPPSREASRTSPSREVCRASPSSTSPTREASRVSPPLREVFKTSPSPRASIRTSPSPPRELCRSSPSPPIEFCRTNPPTVLSPKLTVPKAPPPTRNAELAKTTDSPPTTIANIPFNKTRRVLYPQYETASSIDVIKSDFRKQPDSFTINIPSLSNSDDSINDKDSEVSSNSSSAASWDAWTTAKSEICFEKPTISEAVMKILKGRFPAIHPCLRPSLFSNVPPYVRFYSHSEKAEESMPLPIQKILKWKLTLITPVVVRKTVANSGFKFVRKSNDWYGSWGKHMKSVCFKTLRENQKLNHFPGTFQIGRKDRLWENIYRMMLKYGKKEFGFIPRTFVLPKDTKALKDAWDETETKSKWIVKPPACARGTGIRVIHKWAQIPKRAPIIVQKYISNPFLINGNKFDLRLYVLVTSFNPLRVYLYDNGLVRFASVKYSDDLGSLNDRYMHLTNYSINKLSNNYTQNEDAEACMGHKWTVKSLWNYLEGSVDVKGLWDRLADLVIKTMISGDTQISQLTRSNLNSRYCSYELFGVDVLLDEKLNPWLLEVNISPSLHSASPLDLAVKGPMVQDLMNMAGYHIPNKLSTAQETEFSFKMGLTELPLTYDPRMYVMGLSCEEKKKHAQFFKVRNREQYLDPILEDLTPDDVRHLVQYEDEFTQSGNFQKIFPTPDTHSYHKFFKGRQYYYNKLFDAWESKYHYCREEGISLLESYCQKKVHLDVLNVQNRSTSFYVNEENAICEDSPSFESSPSSASSKSSSIKLGDRLPRIKASKVGHVMRPHLRAAAIIARRKARKQKLYGNQPLQVQLDAQENVTL